MINIQHSVEDVLNHIWFTVVYKTLFNRYRHTVVLNAKLSQFIIVGGEELTITGERFGTTKLTTRPSFVGDVEVVRKISQTDTAVVIRMPPLANGVHNIKLYIENIGYAIKRYRHCY